MLIFIYLFMALCVARSAYDPEPLGIRSYLSAALFGFAWPITLALAIAILVIVNLVSMVIWVCSNFRRN